MRYFNIESNRLTYNKIAPLFAQNSGVMIPDQMFVSEFILALGGDKYVLDAGCGVGQYSLYLTSKGCNVLGIDNSEKMIYLAQNIVSECHFLLENVLDVQYKNQFDGVLANGLFENLTLNQCKIALHKFYDALKDDGVVYLSIINGTGEGFEPEPLAPDLRIYKKRFLPQEFEQIIADEFGIEKVWTIDFVDPSSEGERKHYLLLRKKQKNV